jgi:hypothetical protein
MAYCFSIVYFTKTKLCKSVKQRLLFQVFHCQIIVLLLKDHHCVDHGGECVMILDGFTILVLDVVLLDWFG